LIATLCVENLYELIAIISFCVIYCNLIET
jgi:hypothetical protein